MDLSNKLKFTGAVGERNTMDRLTRPDEPIEGGMRRAVVDTWAAKEQAMTMYWRLKKYEDTGLEPGEILTGVQLAEIACMQIRFKKNAGVVGTGSRRNRKLLWHGNGTNGGYAETANLEF